MRRARSSKPGQGLTRRGRAAVALEDAAGIPVVGMESPRGTADLSPAHSADAAQADCVPLIGKRPTSRRNSVDPCIRRPMRIRAIDADQIELERSRRAVGERPNATA
jgi:acetolactate synthase-1/2/3 large subunit